MADRGETIRDLLQGFNAMQQQLGLLPPQNNQSPLGVGLPTSLPPPPVPHPGQASMIANQMGMSGAQQTISAAQQTRYVPPPSTPIFNPMSGGGMLSPTLGAISGSQLNPYMANAMGGGTMSMPSPIYNTASQYGIYRPPAPSMMPMATGFATPNMFNPFSPGIPGPQFMPPSMHAHALHQSLSSQAASMAVGGAAGLASMGGSMLGAAAFGGKGLLGMLGGGVAGGLVGMGASSLVNLMARPYLREVGMGNMIADQSRSFMVGGGFMGPGGAGFDMGSSRQIARGLMGFGRDFGMQRELGFNTSDYTKIFSLAGQHGMMDMAQSPDQVLSQVKNVAKSVKAFMQIAQEPDVREAMKMMGQLRTMGLNLQETNAAAFNARQFARMAGVSMQAGMNMYGNPGAAMAQGIGLSGGLGFNVGMASGGMARLAVAGGAFNEQQLAMAGGVQGLAQINTTSGLSAVNLNAVLPGLMRNQGGKLSLDQDLVRKYQSGALSIRDLTQMGAQNMRDWGQSGIENITVQMQEQKDSLGRMLGPQGAQMLALRQALDIRKETGGTLGGAFMKLGYGAEQARALELQYSSKGFWDNQSRQMQSEASDMYDRERSRRARYRPPTAVQALRRGVAGFMSDVSDAAARPFRAVGDYLEHAAEDNAAWKRGARIERYADDEIMSSADEEEQVARYMRQEGYKRELGRRRQVSTQRFGAGGNLSMIGASFGVSGIGAAGRDESVYRQMTGQYSSGVAGFAQSAWNMAFDSTPAAVRQAQAESVASAGDALSGAIGSSKEKLKLAREAVSRKGAVAKSGFNVRGMQDAAVGFLLKRADKYHGGAFTNTAALTEQDVEEAAIQGLVSQGMSRDEAKRHYRDNKESIDRVLLSEAHAYASDRDKDVMYNTMDAAERWRSGGQSAKRGLKEAKTEQDKRMAALGTTRGKGGMIDISGITEGYVDRGVVEGAFKKWGSDTDALSVAALSMAAQRGDKTAAAQRDAILQRLPADKRAQVEERAREISAQTTDEEKRALATAAQNLTAAKQDVGGMFESIQKGRMEIKGQAALTSFADRNKDIKALRKFTERGGDVGTMLSELTDEDLQTLRERGQGGLADAAELYRRDKEKGVAAASEHMTRYGDASKKTMVGGMEVSPEMAGRMQMFEKMREEAMASGDVGAAGAAALNTAADKLGLVADKMLGAATKAEAAQGTQLFLGMPFPWATKSQ